MIVDRYDLVIDGYNLLHALGYAQRTWGPGDMQRARERVIRWLSRRLTPDRHPRTLVVFDAAETDSRYVHQVTVRRFRLLFSPHGLQADDLIEDLIDLHSAPRRLQIVSSDHRLHRAARRRRAACMDSEDFIGLLARAHQQARETATEEEAQTKPLADLPDQISHWLKIFAEAQQLADREPQTKQSSSARGDSTPNAHPVASETADRSPSNNQSPEGPAPAGSRPPATDERPNQSGTPPDPLCDPPSLQAEPALQDEIAFWEARIRELLRESGDPPTRRRRDRR